MNNKKFDAAEKLLLKAHASYPKDPDTLRFLSVIAAFRFDYARALELIDRVLTFVPSNGVAHSNRGNILKELGRHQEAIACFDRAIELSPDYAEAYNNKGNLLLDIHLYQEAIACFDRAIELSPDYAEAYNNKGSVYELMGHPQDALHFFDIATTINPQYVDAYWNKALTQLSIGDYRSGWQNYEARWTKTYPVPHQYADLPRLECLEEATGMRVLVWAEQGLGDSIQFCRYLGSLAKICSKVTFLIPSAIVGIMNTLESNVEVVVAGNGLVGKFDFQSPLLSLPLLYRTTVESVPRNIPYLNFDETKKREFERRFPRVKALKVGLVWNGGYRAPNSDGYAVNLRRNIDFLKMAILKDTQNVEFYSLQKGDHAEAELRRLRDGIWPDLIDCADFLSDLTDTAAVVSSLDLIISVDTSVAHLAGALGKPVWILNRYDSCWRWLRGRSDSPWYPTARIYQQASPGDWDGVIERVRKDLVCMVGTHNRGQPIS